MFDRPKHLPISLYERERVKLAAGETSNAAYQSWFARISKSPRFCKRHTRTSLAWSRGENSILPVYDHEEFRRWGENTVAKEGEFNFQATLSCPACRVEHARCPPEFHETDFGTFETSTAERAAALAKASEFAAHVNAHGCGFAQFVGLPGTGKTRLACNIIRELRNRDTLYIRQGELTIALRGTYGRKEVILHRSERRYDEGDDDDDAPPNPLEIVQNVRFLVLDELGCTPLANDERLILDELLKHRYEHRKPTILISNLPLTGRPDSPGLKEFLGDALADRIREASGNGKFIVQFSGGSYRRATGESYLNGLAVS